ncbi:MAG: thiazole synthase [Lentisphaerae bacterium RIFOXYB12_FULL_65_16]|nr:MAG: thiazole synthase [Lentisphaerae bacterium RIFOXYA12_64_32]OGV88802.1 MAG: thiazole synthase [Lentisphaerae bacterium RIFOXYB12_FULL_65_16]
MDTDHLELKGHRFTSRLIMGTGKFADTPTMCEAIKASGTQLVTVALRRFNPDLPGDDLLGPLLALPGVTLMPNTSGARDAREAIRAAHIARDLSGSPFIKVEIHPNPHHLMPDAIETYEACKVLAAEGFVVMPYMPPDPVLAKRLEDVGCASVMPLGSAIGSGHGLAAAELLRLILRDSGIPVIVDAGLRAPSEAAAAMEMGCAAVLINSAVAAAANPPAMAAAFAQAVQAGRAARHAGLMPRSEMAVATSPLTSFLGAAQ